MYLILAYYPLTSSGRIQCPNRAIHQFGCNDVFGILTAVAAFDGDDDDGMRMRVQVMITNIRNSLSIWNQLIGRIAVFGWDFHPLIGAQMRATGVKSGNLAICLVFVNAPKQMPLQSWANVNASNRPTSLSPIVIHQLNNESIPPNHSFELHLQVKKTTQQTRIFKSNDSYWNINI